MAIHRVEQAVVQGGQVVLSGLAMADGSRVDVVVTEAVNGNGRGIDEVRKLLRGAVEQYEDPFEPATELPAGHGG